MRDRRGRPIVEQLIDSAGSISANIEEGYGRGYGKARDHFLRIAVGSARETRGWYYRSRHLLSSTVIDHRMTLASEVIALLVTELNQQRRHR
jgi:four helix bundle protein